MKWGFYPKIAVNNIQKNRRFYLPRILAEAGLEAAFYIVLTLAYDGRLAALRGGDYIISFMMLGVLVMIILSAILMLYTNSFLMKQRKRELGIYNILGMEKRHVAKVLFHESMISSFAAIVLGLFSGMIFYKLCSLIICGLLKVDSVLGFYFITPKTLVPSACFFLILDLMTFVMNRFTIARMKPVELLRSKSEGEREPKIHWISLLIGILSIGAGYYFAVTVQSPLEAVNWFFTAVILVIIGTYFLFVAGSTFILKCMKKNKRFYYHRRRMTAVSGLLYRMKQNAVGLASICILATAVMVMLSTTISLYAGIEETINNNYPHQLYINAQYTDCDGNIIPVTTDEMESIVTEAAKRQGISVTYAQESAFLEATFCLNDGVITAENTKSISNAAMLVIMTEEEYISHTGTALNLAENEIAISEYALENPYPYDFLEVEGTRLQVKTKLDVFPEKCSGYFLVPCYGVVVADDAIMNMIYEMQETGYGENASPYTRRLIVDFSNNRIGSEDGALLEENIDALLREYLEKQEGFTGEMGTTSDPRWETMDSLYGMYASLLFLGLILGFVFLFATALIIYYKQISEGYEDRDRYQIMEKIGMSSDEVKKTINSQIILVFFLPLVVAGIHVCFAFPILEKLLHILLLSSTMLFVKCSILIFLLFAMVYTIIYIGTARTYYKIVH